MCSPAMQTPLAPIAAPPWTRQRLAKLDEPRRQFGSSRVSGLHRFADSSRSRLSSRPRSLPSATQSSANRLRPSADFETGGRRRRRRIRKRPCGWVDRHAKTSATCVASRRYQRTLLRRNCARFAPHAKGCWPLRRHKKVNSYCCGTDTRSAVQRFLVVRLRDAAAPARFFTPPVTSVGNPRVSSLRR